MILKEYQEKAVTRLFSGTIQLLAEPGEKSIVFKAPTGSGKTVMMQAYLKRIAETPKTKDVSYVWISVNDLSRQSKRSFEKNLAGSRLRFSELSDLTDKEIKADEVLFINWESIRSVSKETGEWKVLAMKENERDENLPTYLSNTHKSGRDVVLIVDESHRSLNTAKAQELIGEYIKPKLQVEVSATPDSENYDQKVEVRIEDVIEAGMIKREILINPWVGKISEDITETDRFILKTAVEKRQGLSETYAKAESFVRPLILVQLPSESKSTSEIDRTKLERVKRILSEDFDITTENKRLAIWLDKEKENLDWIEDFDCAVEVLIFKQAIATGWDCPRAHILVMFREIGSVTFQIQTVGRILRMPELRHYGNGELDTAYVYTDLETGKIGIHETAKNLIKDRFGKRDDALYSEIQLPSSFLKRVEYKDLGLSFYEVLTETFLETVGAYKEEMSLNNLEKLKTFVDTENTDISSLLITDWRILVDIDTHTNEKIYSETNIEAKTEEELVKLRFDTFCREQVRPQFSNVARSYKAIIEALYLTMEEYFFGTAVTRYKLQCIILHNSDFFVKILTGAKGRYIPVRQLEVEKKRKSEISVRLWEVPSTIAYSDESIILDTKRNIINPGYCSKLSEGEASFIENYLEKDESVVWWFKNWVKSEQFFSIVYKDEAGETSNFFPDFIVCYKDGTIGIFDPKSGFTLTEWRPKHRALTKHIEKLVAEGWKIIGGFVRTEGKTVPKTYVTSSDEYATEGLKGWELLN